MYIKGDADFTLRVHDAFGFRYVISFRANIPYNLGLQSSYSLHILILITCPKRIICDEQVFKCLGFILKNRSRLCDQTWDRLTCTRLAIEYGLVLRWSIVQELDGIEETKAACGTERIRYKYILQRGSNSQTPTGQGSEGGSRWSSQRQGRQTK